MSEPTLQIKVIDKSVYPVPPRRAHPDDAGVDLRATETYAIRPGSSALVDLGVKVAVPRGYVGQLLVRSSVGFGRLLLCTGGAGVIDAGYRGRVKLPLVNVGAKTQTVERGERVAQLVAVPCSLSEETVDELGETGRGAGGFGSSGRF